jgi:hypothetical protein
MACYRVNGDPIFTPEQLDNFEENRQKIEDEIAQIPRENIEKKEQEQYKPHWLYQIVQMKNG